MEYEMKQCKRCIPKPIYEFSDVFNKRTGRTYKNNICKACAKLTALKKQEELKRTAKKPVVDFGDPEAVKKWNQDNGFVWSYVEEKTDMRDHKSGNK